jgi:hypothetical protein
VQGILVFVVTAENLICFEMFSPRPELPARITPCDVIIHMLWSPYRFGFLDKLMSEIPGKDNYGANIEDDALGQLALSMNPENEGEILNAAYYHRYYKVKERGAMGQQLRHRGFSDSNLWMAMNTQAKVAG